MIKTIPAFFINYFRAKRLSQKISIGEKHKRIYHYHIRKAGGTSLNYILLSKTGKNGSKIYNELTNTFGHLSVSNNKPVLGWNKFLIEKGNYWYAFSHKPLHQLKLPPKTFTVTIIRNPLKRVVSLYKMIMKFHIHEINHPIMEKAESWLGKNFSDFVNNLPEEHALEQIYKFSKEYSVDEAFDRIISLNHFFLTKDFNRGIQELSKKLNIKLKPKHVRKSSYNPTISDEEMQFLKKRLLPEIKLYKKLKKYLEKTKK